MKIQCKINCFKGHETQEICGTDDELKAIYHSKDSFCI